MHFRNIIIAFAFLLLSSNAWTQTLTGVISEHNGNEAMAGVVVVNRSLNLSTMTDEKGKYAIKAMKGNEIVISYLGYNSISFLMPAAEDVYRNIWLKKNLIALNEVQIRPDYTPYQLDSMARRSLYNEALSRERVSSSVLGSIMSPATAVAEQFSKKAKQRHRFQKNYWKWEDQKFIDTRYTSDMVQNLTGLYGDSLANFMNAYPIAAEYARTATDLELKMWVKYNYRQWQKQLLNSDSLNVKPQVDSLNSEQR